MKSWKKMAVVSTAFIAAAVLAACSSGGSSTSSSSKTITIGLWKGSDAESAAFNKLVKQFESDNSGVTVKTKIYTDYTTQLTTDLSGGTVPDVFYVDSSFYPYLQKNSALADLSSVVKSSDFISNVAKQFTTDGKLYAAPKDVSTLAIYVNKGIFAKAGIDEASIPKSWEDFITWAPSAQAKLDAAYGAGKVKLINVNADLNRVWQFVAADSQNPITSDGKSDFSNSTIVNNLETVQKLFNTGAVATPKDMGQGDEGAGFGNGVFAMALTGNWNVVQLNTNFSSVKYDVIPNLTYKNVKQTMMYTVGWGEYKGTKVADTANKWIQFITSKDGMSTLTEGVGTLPSRQDVADASSFFKSNPALQVHQAELAYATPWQNGTNLSTISTSFNNFITNAFKKGATTTDLKTALKSADDDANSKISK